MKAFVTGGTGLVGRHLAAALLERGWEVAVLTRDPGRNADLAARGVRLVQGDVTLPDFGRDLAATDVLFHAAAWFEVGARDGKRMFDVNVRGTANVLTLARKANVPRIVYTSTAGLFGPAPRERPATEESTPSAAVDDPYVATKLEAHHLVENEMHAGLPVTIVAPLAVFGPWDTGQLGRSLALLAKGRLRVLPEGFGINTWTHAADAAVGHVLAATAGKAGEMYFLGDRILSFYEFMEAAARAADVEPPKRRVSLGLARAAARGSELRARVTRRTPLLTRAALELGALDIAVDSSKARRDLHWSPAPFEDRIKEAMAWYADTYRTKGRPLPVKPSGASA